MKKMSTLLAALLFASASAAFAQTSNQPTQPAKPTTNAGAATTVETNPAATQSGGKADKGLDNAEAHITAKHGKGDKDKAKAEKDKGVEKGKGAEKADRADKPEHASKPERPGR